MFYTHADPPKSLPPIPVRVSRRSQLTAALRQHARPIVIEDQELAGPFVRLLRARMPPHRPWHGHFALRAANLLANGANAVSATLAMDRLRSSRGRARKGAVLGSTSARNMAAAVDLAEPCSPERTRTGYGPQLRSAASSQATASTKSLVVRTFKNGRSAEIDPPRAATGKGSIPGARRNRIGGAATTCQPSGPISIARHVSSQRSR